MNHTFYFDYEPFAARIAQVTTGNLTEDEFKNDFPEIEYLKVGADIGDGKTIKSIDKFMVKGRAIFQIAKSETELSIFKIAVFGNAPTPEEEVNRLTIKRNALLQRVAEYQVPGVVVIDPKTFEPFDEDSEEGCEAKDQFLSDIQSHIREIDTEITAARALMQ